MACVRCLTAASWMRTGSMLSCLMVAMMTWFAASLTSACASSLNSSEPAVPLARAAFLTLYPKSLEPSSHRSPEIRVLVISLRRGRSEKLRIADRGRADIAIYTGL